MNRLTTTTSRIAEWHKKSEILVPGDVVEAFVDYAGEYKDTITIILRRVPNPHNTAPTFEVQHPFQWRSPYALNFGFGFRKIGHIELPKEEHDHTK